MARCRDFRRSRWERLFLPDVVPAGYAEDPRPLWSLATAFMLCAIDLMAAGVAIIALVLMLGVWTNSRRRTF